MTQPTQGKKLLEQMTDQIRVKQDSFLKKKILFPDHTLFATSLILKLKADEETLNKYMKSN